MPYELFLETTHSQKVEIIQVSINQWTDKCSIFTTEYYSVMRKNEALIHAKTWQSLENIAPSRSQSLKATQCMIPFPWNVPSREIQRDGKSGGCQETGEEWWRTTVMDGGEGKDFIVEWQLINRERMTGNHRILQNNWPGLFKNIEVQNDRERLRKHSRLKKTKTTW